MSDHVGHDETGVGLGRCWRGWTRVGETGQELVGPGRTWHHRRTLRPAVTGDVRPELWMARDGRPLPARAAAARRREKDAGHEMGDWCVWGGSDGRFL